MTRGMVKSKLIIICYDKWVIRSQVPSIYGMQFIDYMLVGASLRYSQAPLERVQEIFIISVKWIV